MSTKQRKTPCIFGCQRIACRNSEMCSTCRNGLRYWDDRDFADVLKREEHLQVLSNRIHRLAATRKRKVKVQPQVQPRQPVRRLKLNGHAEARA